MSEQSPFSPDNSPENMPTSVKVSPELLHDLMGEDWRIATTEDLVPGAVIVAADTQGEFYPQESVMPGSVYEVLSPLNVEDNTVFAKLISREGPDNDTTESFNISALGIGDPSMSGLVIGRYVGMIHEHPEVGLPAIQSHAELSETNKSDAANSKGGSKKPNIVQRVLDKCLFYED